MTPECNCGNSDVIKNEAAGNEFYYCRSCKQEVNEHLASVTLSSDMIRDAYLRICRPKWWDDDDYPF